MSFKEKRVSVNLTQAQVAEQVGVKRSTVAMWETGESKPRANTLVQLAGIYKCTVDALLV